MRRAGRASETMSRLSPSPLSTLSTLCKYLHNRESVGRGERDLVPVTRSAVARGKYHLTRRMIYGAKRPFWDYWEDALDFMVDVEPAAWKGVA